MHQEAAEARTKDAAMPQQQENQQERNSEISQSEQAGEEGGEDEMTEPQNEGEDIADSGSEKDDPMVGNHDGEPKLKLQRKPSIMSPQKGAN